MPGTAQQTPLNPGQQEELEERLRNGAKEGRINCARALAIAKSLGIPPAEVGKTANKLNIKISNCQLGCF